MKYNFEYIFLETMMTSDLILLGMSIQAKEYVWVIIFVILSVILGGLYLLMIQLISKTGTILLPFWLSLVPKKIREKVIEELK